MSTAKGVSRRQRLMPSAYFPTIGMESETIGLSSPNAVTNACTIDVEDYYHVSAFEKVIAREDWHTFESRVVPSTRFILEQMHRAGVRGTFFILGWVAAKHPELVREIHAAGHEIGCHSFEHRLIYQMELEDFRADLRKGRDTLEEIIGEPVRSFRAPSFSITKKSIAALEVLVEEGFRFDSSIFPIYHDRYGITGTPIGPYIIDTPSGELVEFPPSVYRICGWNVPVAGGGYFRLYPYHVTRWLINAINAQGRSVNLYLHPWEFDPDQPRVDGASRLSTFRHTVNLNTTAAKFSRLLKELRFAPMGQLLDKSSEHELPLYEFANGRLRIAEHRSSALVGSARSAATC